MKLSTRSRYGFRAMLELSLAYGQGPLQIRTISERQDISGKYLEQLIATLKSNGLVRSIRGPKGGYLLTKPPSDIKLSDIFSALEGPIVTVDCLIHMDCCPKQDNCPTRPIWLEIQNAVENVLKSKTLQDMMDGSGKAV